MQRRVDRPAAEVRPQHTVAGLLFPPGDPAKMGAQLERLLDDAGLRGRLREQARRRAADFDGHRAIEQMQTLYERIMAGTPGG